MSADGIIELKRIYEQCPLRYFSVAELLTMGGSHYAKKAKNSTIPQRYAHSLYAIGCQANEIRTRLGRPVLIVSGYRSESYNDYVGGAYRSYHLKGRALDLKPVNSKYLPELKLIGRDLHDEGLVGGLGFYSTFMHVDTGPKRRWG